MSFIFKIVDQVRCSHTTAVGSQKRFLESVSMEKKPRRWQPKKFDVRGERICQFISRLHQGTLKDMKLDADQDIEI